MDVPPTIALEYFGWILFIFSIQEYICHMSVPDEFEYSTSKNMGSSDEQQNIMAIFSNDFD
jgi:hypothetical protein